MTLEEAWFSGDLNKFSECTEKFATRTFQIEKVGEGHFSTEGACLERSISLFKGLFSSRSIEEIEFLAGFFHILLKRTTETSKKTEFLVYTPQDLVKCLVDLDVSSKDFEALYEEAQKAFQSKSLNIEEFRESLRRRLEKSR